MMNNFRYVILILSAVVFSQSSYSMNKLNTIDIIKNLVQLQKNCLSLTYKLISNEFRILNEIKERSTLLYCDGTQTVQKKHSHFIYSEFTSIYFKKRIENGYNDKTFGIRFLSQENHLMIESELFNPKNNRLLIDNNYYYKEIDESEYGWTTLVDDPKNPKVTKMIVVLDGRDFYINLPTLAQVNVSAHKEILKEDLYIESFQEYDVFSEHLDLYFYDLHNQRLSHLRFPVEDYNLCIKKGIDQIFDGKKIDELNVFASTIKESLLKKTNQVKNIMAHNETLLELQMASKNYCMAHDMALINGFSLAPEILGKTLSSTKELIAQNFNLLDDKNSNFSVRLSYDNGLSYQLETARNGFYGNVSILSENKIQQLSFKSDENQLRQFVFGKDFSLFDHVNSLSSWQDTSVGFRSRFSFQSEFTLGADFCFQKGFSRAGLFRLCAGGDASLDNSSIFGNSDVLFRSPLFDFSSIELSDIDNAFFIDFSGHYNGQRDYFHGHLGLAKAATYRSYEYSILSYIGLGVSYELYDEQKLDGGVSSSISLFPQIFMGLSFDDYKCDERNKINCGPSLKD